MKTLRDFIEESVEFRGTKSPIVILNGKDKLLPSEEEKTLLNSTFNGLRVLAVQKNRKLFIGDQFKETHESIVKRFSSTLRELSPIKSAFSKGLCFPLIADGLELNNKFALTDSIFSPENSPFTGKPVNDKIKLINFLLDKWRWLNDLCAYYKFQESGGQKVDKVNLLRLKKDPKFKSLIDDSPLSTGLWVSSGLLSDLN